MDKRREELTQLKSYTEGIDNELTMILQSLQWDRKHLLQNPVLITCRYDSNHKVPPNNCEEHEKECFLRQNGYTKDDQLLSDPLDTESNTLVKLGKGDIEQIIGNAARSDPSFKKGMGCRGAEPLSLARLHMSYSADERRAIHDAVVSAVPSCHDLTDLALLGGDDEKSSQVVLSRMEILVQLRDMRRRRAKYRVAAKTRNYSDVLRDVIRTQMEHFNEGQTQDTTNETIDVQNNRTDRQSDRHLRQTSKDDDRFRNDRRSRDMPRPKEEIEIKTEKEDSADGNRDYSKDKTDRAYRYEDDSRDKRGRDRYRHSQRERNDDVGRSDKYLEQSRKRRHDNKYYEQPEEKRRNREKGYNHEKGSRSYHKNRDEQVQVKKEPGYDDYINKYHEERSRERRHGENSDKNYKQKDRTTERNYDENRRKNRGRSRENIRDYTYKDGPSERVYIKQEREDGTTREDRSYDDKDKRKDKRLKSKDSRKDRSYRETSYDSYSSEVRQDKYNRYYDIPSKDVYDPYKKIKAEK